MDGNFQAEHMRMKNPKDDILLSNGTGFMVSKEPYKSHLKSAVERWQVSSTFCVLAGIHSLSDRDQLTMTTVQ